jgi:hypothetical protein
VKWSGINRESRHERVWWQKIHFLMVA